MHPTDMIGTDSPRRHVLVDRLRTVRVLVIADFPTLQARWGPKAAYLRVVEALDGARETDDYSVMLMDRDRRHGGSDRARLRRLRNLRAATKTRRVLLAVNQRPDLATAVDADGVQLPERGVAVPTVRRCFPDLMIGRSCHDREGLEAAVRDGADWATVAPVHRPISKNLGQSPPLGAAGYVQIVEGLNLLTFALGGMTPANVAEIALVEKRRRVASIGSVLLADRPADALASLLRAAAGPSNAGRTI